MAECFLVQSGGVALNFKVVGGLEQPATPKENTLWVNTDQEITGWVFDAKEPVEPQEGVVWFYISDFSSHKLNAVKKNAVNVYLVQGKQYISGAFTDVSVNLFQDGEWKAVITTLVLLDANGFHKNFSKKGTSNQYCSVSIGTNSFTVSANNTEHKGVYAWGAFDEKIDLTPYSAITFTVSGGQNHRGSLGASTSTSYGGYVASKSVSGNGTFKLDISDLKGEYYIVSHAYGDSSPSSYTVNYIELTV
jgi:hypothetical protein